MTILDPKSGFLSDRFVRGYVDEQGHIHKDFVVRELTGVEEDILLGKGPVTARLNQVILNCMVSVGDITERATLMKVIRDMSAVDRMIALIALRRCSLGDEFTVSLELPGCKEAKSFVVDLSSLERKEYEGGSSGKQCCTLSSGRVVEWHVMDGNDEEWMTSMQDRLDGADKLTLSLLARVDAVDDVKLTRGPSNKKGKKIDQEVLASMKILKGLTMRERNELREQFTLHEGTLDSELDFDYTDDNGNRRAVKSAIPFGDRNFFFPQGE